MTEANRLNLRKTLHVAGENRIYDVARYTGIDRTYLYRIRIFIEHEHLSPKEYLMRHHLRTATEMLCTTDYSITEIALSCGFRDGSAFSGYFREQVGMTPRGGGGTAGE